MRHGHVIAAATVLLLGTGIAAHAECDPNTMSGCSRGILTGLFNHSDAQEAAPAQASESAAEPAQTTKAPMQLRRYMKRGPAQHTTARRSQSHHTAHRWRKHRSTVARKEPEKTRTPATAPKVAESPKPNAPLKANVVSTVAVAAPTASSGQQAIGFAATHELRNQAGSSFVQQNLPAEPEKLPADIEIVPNDQVNAIDLAADTPSKGGDSASAASTQAHGASVSAQTDGLSAQTDGMSLVSRAEAAEPIVLKSTGEETSESWPEWLYRMCTNGLSAVGSALHALFT